MGLLAPTHRTTTMIQAANSAIEWQQGVGDITAGIIPELLKASVAGATSRSKSSSRLWPLLESLMSCLRGPAKIDVLDDACACDSKLCDCTSTWPSLISEKGAEKVVDMLTDSARSSVSWSSDQSSACSGLHDARSSVCSESSDFIEYTNGRPSPQRMSMLERHQRIEHMSAIFRIPC